MEYLLRRRHLSRHIRITVHPDGRVVVSAPLSVSQRIIDQFISQKRSWIQEKQSRVSCGPKRTRYDYLQYKEKARVLVERKIKQFNAFYQFSFQRISIRDQKTRWGSCSKKGNLNFNYKIVFLEESLADYLVVHELCHLKEFNHSKAFWKLVEKTIPSYQQARYTLQKKGLSLY